MTDFFQSVLSQYLSGFQCGPNVLLHPAEGRKKDLDRKGKQIYGMLLSDLSKMIDCLPCQLLICKHNA